MRADLLVRRSLSWLDANSRVLAQVQDPRVPVLERAKFLAILGANVDEFFAVCGSSLRRDAASGAAPVVANGLLSAQECAVTRVRELIGAQRRYFLDDIHPMLAADGIVFRRPKDTTEEQRRVLGDFFHRVVLPLLTPLAIDPGHPFPYLKHRSVFLVASIRASEPSTLPSTMLSVIPVPSAALPRFIALPDVAARHAFILLEDVIRLHLSMLYRDAEVLSSPTIRITRDRCRDSRAGAPVRLEHDEDVPLHLLDTLLAELGLTAGDAYGGDSFVGLSDLFQLYTSVSGSRRRETPRQDAIAAFETAPSIWDDEDLAAAEISGRREGIVA